MPQLLTNYHVKLLAALLMLIDHVGAVFFPDLTILRMIGRLSFPLFAWLLVQGENHTRNIKGYALRLLGLGIISQPIYMLTFEVIRLNILFTLLLGLIGLRLARSFPRWQLPIWIVSSILATIADLEYGSYGIAMIALIKYFKPDWLWWACWVGLHVVIKIALPEYGSLQFLAVFAALIFEMANHQRGAKARWFYWFYPLHLLALTLIKMTENQTLLPLLSNLFN